MNHSFHIEGILKNSNMLEKDLPLRSARELNKLPDSAIPETYQAAIELAREEGKKLGAKHVEEAVAEWKAKHESAQKRIDWLELDKKAIHEQNDQLRNDLAFKVDEKVALERAKLIEENQQAIAENKRLAENAQHELERLKREQQKAIAENTAFKLDK